jgi:hypothetical protein
MQFAIQKRVDFSRELPAEIQTAYLRHTIQVQFEQYYLPVSQRTEPQEDQLIEWCDLNCDDIYSITRRASNCALFRFYLKSDMHRFEQHLKDSVAIAADHTS